MIRERMVRRHISIPESLDDDMRSYIAENTRRWGKGEFSDLVIDAVRSYIDPGTHTQKQSLRKHSNRKYDTLFTEIKDYLRSKYHYGDFTDSTVHKKLLYEAIGEIMQVRDPRSIKNYIRKLEEGKYIQRLIDDDWNETHLFKVLEDASNAKNVSLSSTERARDIVKQ